MVSSRRTRVILVVAWTLIIALLFLGFHRTQQEKSTAKFLDSIDEKERLDNAELNKPKGGPGPAGAAQDLTNKPDQPFSPEKEYNAILSEAPVVIFSKSYCPHCKFVKDLLLSEYQINPQPWVVELDLHPHGRELQDYIVTITGRSTVPNVHVKKVSKGGGDEFRELHASGQLTTQMQNWGGSALRIKRLSPPSGG